MFTAHTLLLVHRCANAQNAYLRMRYGTAFSIKLLMCDE